MTHTPPPRKMRFFWRLQLRQHIGIEGSHVETRMTKLLLHKSQVVGFRQQHRGIGMAGTVYRIVFINIGSFEGFLEAQAETGGGELFAAMTC